MPLVIAYHLIWTAYGWWLPNDPRGSTSKLVRRDYLKELGELHFGRKRIQPASWKIRDFYENAADSLLNALLTFTSTEITSIGEAFTAVIRDCKYTCYACAIMPDHVHILIRKHKHLAEEMILNLQRAANSRLQEFQFRDENQRTWSSAGGWNVFLDHPDEVRRTIGYINDNPIKIGLPSAAMEFRYRTL
jgi:REP element-mobilizing transposase RayT